MIQVFTPAEQDALDPTPAQAIPGARREVLELQADLMTLRLAELEGQDVAGELAATQADLATAEARYASLKAARAAELQAEAVSARQAGELLSGLGRGDSARLAFALARQADREQVRAFDEQRLAGRAG